jgi:hypothetical protein
MAEKKNVQKFGAETLETKRPFGRTRHRWEDRTVLTKF